MLAALAAVNSLRVCKQCGDTGSAARHEPAAGLWVFSKATQCLQTVHASQVPDTGGVYIVPAFSGLLAPHWDNTARGTILGLTGARTGVMLECWGVSSSLWENELFCHIYH